MSFDADPGMLAGTSVREQRVRGTRVVCMGAAQRRGGRALKTSIRDVVLGVVRVARVPRSRIRRRRSPPACARSRSRHWSAPCENTIVGNGPPAAILPHPRARCSASTFQDKRVETQRSGTLPNELRRVDRLGPGGRRRRVGGIPDIDVHLPRLALRRTSHLEAFDGVSHGAIRAATAAVGAVDYDTCGESSEKRRAAAL